MSVWLNCTRCERKTESDIKNGMRCKACGSSR